MTKQQITWTRSLAGAYRHDETGFAIQQGESGNWFVFDAEDMIVGSGRTLTMAKVAAKPLVLATMQAEDEEETECPICGGPLASDGVCADDRCGSEDDTDEPEHPVATITVTRDERTMAFDVETAAEVTSFWGTALVPNRCDARFFNGKLVSVSLGRLDKDGWTVDDPAGPDGAGLDVSYGGGELTARYRAKLPQVAQDIIAHLETLER